MADELKRKVAAIRADILKTEIKTFIEGLPRVLADADVRKEVKEMRSRCLPLIVQTQWAMLQGDLHLDKEWYDCAEKFVDRAEGKPVQPIGGDQERPLRISTIEVRLNGVGD